MADFDNKNRGVLFKEFKKETEKHPDYKGNINIDGKEYWLSGWKRQSQKGAPYLSLSIKEKGDWVESETREKLQKDEVQEVTDEPINLDEIPF